MLGQRIVVEIDASARTAKYSLHEGDGLMIRHEDQEIHLTKDLVLICCLPKTLDPLKP